MSEIAPPGWPRSRPWDGSGWLSIPEARAGAGIRLTDSPYWGAWWAQALRGLLHVKGLAYRKVVHPPYRDDDPLAQRELFEWTAQSSVPVLAYREKTDQPDRIRSDWLGQLMLIEELAPGPALVPAQAQARIHMFGLANELMSPQGFMWQGRIAMSESYRDANMTETQRAFFGRGPFLGGKYAYNGRDMAPLEAMRETLRALAAVCRSNSSSPYLIGDTLTALDVYWVYASNFVSILPPEQLPVMRFNRAMYPAINAALSDVDTSDLIAHRDYVLREHLPCPVEVD